MAQSEAAKIRAQLDHPVLDADGHWIESPPVYFEYRIHFIDGSQSASRQLYWRRKFGRSPRDSSLGSRLFSSAA